jgi:hypothetical protein
MPHAVELSLAPINRSLVIVSVRDTPVPFLFHGLVQGEILRVLSNFKSQPLRIEIRNTFLAIDRHLANFIMVEPAA